MDGGRTWTPGERGVETPSTPLPLVAYAFRSGQIWRLGRTTDDGRTWSSVRGPCPRADGAAPSFGSRRRGWVVCTLQAAAGSQPKAVYETADGATSWRLVAKGSFAAGTSRGGLSVFGYVGGLTFVRSGRGLLWETRGSTYRTSNGGRSWRGLSVTAPETREGLSGWLVDDRLGFLLLQNDRRARYELLRTDDGGTTWKLVRIWPRA